MKKRGVAKQRWVWVVPLIVAVVIVVAAVVGLVLRDPNKEICTTYVDTVERQCASDYLGLTQPEAVTRAIEFDLIPMVIRVDGEDQPTTDIGGNLVLLDVSDNLVVKVCFQSTIPVFYYNEACMWDWDKGIDG